MGPTTDIAAIIWLNGPWCGQVIAVWPSCIWGYTVDGFRAGGDTWSARAAEARIWRARDSVVIAEHRCRFLVPRAALRTRRARDFAATVVLHWPKLIRYPTQVP